MSRDAIAEVLGRLDYGDHPDEVDWRDRLREVDGLLEAGVVVDVDDLLIDTDVMHWQDLRRVLRPLGWLPLVVWGDRLQTVWAPPSTTHEQVARATAPHVDVWHGITWWPALLTDEQKDSIGVDLMDDGAGQHDVDNADELLAWLATP